jgi:hypothetical protein
MWKVLIEIFVDYVVLRVDETRIEVALEHHRNPLDCQVRLHRLNLLGSQLKCTPRPHRQPRSHNRHSFHKIAAFHREQILLALIPMP